MSDAPQSRDDLTRLLSALADGTLEAADEERLAEVLRTDPAARAKYYDHVMLAALLRREGRRAAAQNQAGGDSCRRTPCDEAEPLTQSQPVRHVSRTNLSASRLRPWLLVLAASVLLGLLLSVGEATGVTQFVPTIIRIVTGEGSLLIEVVDPSVSVTLEGEDVKITGAGLHELRLRPGKHRVLTTRDGKKLHEEAVVIERGGKQVVKVSQESSRSTSDFIGAEQAPDPSTEAERLCTLCGSLMAADPWQAELHLRKAVALCEQLVQDSPSEPKYQQQHSKSRRYLSMALNYQVHYFVSQNKNPDSEAARHAIAIAKEATELSPFDAGFWTSLGRAHYRAKEWEASLAALQKGSADRDYNGCGTRFHLAMVHWQLGNKDEARKFYDQAVQWMDANKPDDQSLRRDRAEATALLERAGSTAQEAK